jgi:N6-adenosine-specific RNA methylase IME4
MKITAAVKATLKVSEVKTRGHPKPNPDHVASLIESIRIIGLLNPITVDRSLNLIAGNHRLAAHRKLGLPTIPANVVDLDELGAELARIDENLIRKVGTALERAEMLADRKEIYERMHPESKQGGAPGRKGGGKSKNEMISGFASDTAKKIGTTDRSVQQYVQAAGLDPEAKMAIRATAAADSLTDLVKLARLAPEHQRAVAHQIAKTGETVKAATRTLKRAEQVEQIKAYVPPEGQFQVITSDPPWPFDDELDGSDAVRGGCPYPTMTIDQICAMKIPAHDDCVLWLWCTNTHLIDGSAPRVLKAWGFTGKTMLTWRKTQMGTGHWLRNITEHVILAVRGTPVVRGQGQTTEFEAPRGAHSGKPDRFFQIVEEVCPSPSRLEMFSRAERPGWITSGAELRKPKGTGTRRKLVVPVDDGEAA